MTIVVTGSFGLVLRQRFKYMNNDSPFHDGEQRAQARWNTADMWDKDRRERLLWNHIPEEFHARIEAAPFFFIATSNATGDCDCSFKGGGPGIVRILDTTRFVFPDFDGNGAFMSIGNILKNPHVGCLFIDFSDGARLRVNGRASVHDEGEFKELFRDAPRVILVEVDQVVPNCAVYVPKLVPAE